MVAVLLFFVGFPACWSLYRWWVKRPIPSGPYCYDANGRCPYWHRIIVTDEGGTGPAGYCRFTGEVDFVLLLDQCKTCGVRDLPSEPV